MVNTSKPHINRVNEDKRNTLTRLSQKACSRRQHLQIAVSQFQALPRNSGHLNTSEMGSRRNKVIPMGSASNTGSKRSASNAEFSSGYGNGQKANVAM